MASRKNWVCWHRKKRIIICMLLLLVSSLNHLRFMQAVESKSDSKLYEAAKGIKRRQRMIGSRPPSCERKCRDCGYDHCEAVLVPVVPRQLQVIQRTSPRKKEEEEEEYYYFTKGVYISNYKPISWKCKCGDFFFNP